MTAPRNDVAKYCDFVNPLISPHTLLPDEKSPTYTNPLIGAIAHPTQFSDFKNAFATRVSLLYKEFKSSSENLKSFIELLNSLVSDKWGGFYSELTAYYVLLQSGFFPIQLNVTLLADLSYAGDVKRKATNEDFYSLHFDFYGDVKRFSDASNEILYGIIKEETENFKNNLGIDIDILPEYTLSIPDENFSSNRKSLKQELTEKVKDLIDKKSAKGHLDSLIVNGLRYNILIGGGVNQAINFYDPYERAEMLKDKILHTYAKKIMKHKPFFLVLVNFPWDNPTDRNSFENNKILYRSLARRTFMQYRYSTIPASAIIPKYTGSDSLFDISKCISGLVFIDDHAIKNGEYSSYVYLNPNAKDLPTRLRMHFGEMMTQHPADNCSEFDDMEHDNY